MQLLLGREWVPHVYPQPAAWKSRTVVLSYQNNLVVKECFGLAFIYYRYFCLSDKFSFCFQSVIAVHSSDQQTHPFNSDTENASINSKVNILHKLKASIFPCKFYIIFIWHNLQSFENLFLFFRGWMDLNTAMDTMANHFHITGS